MRSKTVLVTGDNGFIGRRLVANLLQLGNCVIGIDMTHDDGRSRDNYRAFELDLTEPNSHLADLVQSAHVVLHLAALTKSTDSKQLIEVNSAMTRNLLEASVKTTNSPRFVLVSSIAACGPHQTGQSLTERNELQPVSQYGHSKAACEILVRSYLDRISIAIVRPPIVLGQGDLTGLRLFRTIQKWHRHFVPGPDQRYAVLHVDDLIEAMLMIAEEGESLVESDVQQALTSFQLMIPSAMSNLASRLVSYWEFNG